MSEPFGYSESIPEEIREIYMWLCQDVASLHAKWRLYKGLYSAPDITELLTRIAKHTFVTIEESLRDDMTMCICLLSDPTSLGGHENVSFKALADSNLIRGDISQLINEFVILCNPVVLHRNKRIAHNDKNTLLKPKENILPGLTRSLIEEIVEKAGAILNLVIQQYENSENEYETMDPGTVEEFVYWLKAAEVYSDEGEKKKRLLSEAGMK
jgi:hypothetical protein